MFSVPGLPELHLDMSQASMGEHRVFDGEARVQFIYNPTPPSDDIQMVAVDFAPGARNRPHTHDGNQYLYFIEGRGFVHIAGAEEQVFGPGGVAVIPAGVLHMHGAVYDEHCLHLAMRRSDAATEWNFDEVPAGWDKWLRS